MSVQGPKKKSFDKHPLIAAVGSPEDARSSVWRVWVWKDDVYFGVEGSLSAFKVSLHQSGLWRAAFVRSLADGADRAALKWKRPQPNQSGLIHAVVVAVSPIRPAKPFKPRSVPDQRVHWIAPAAPGSLVALVVIIANPGLDPDPNTFGAGVIGRLKKANGETVWFVRQDHPLTSEIADKIKDSMPKLTVHVSKEAIEQESVQHVRGMLLNNADVIGPNNPPTFFDIEFGWENVSPNQA